MQIDCKQTDSNLRATKEDINLRKATMQQQYRTQRRPKARPAVSRQYTSSFSGIDWGFRSSQQGSSIAADDFLRDSSRQELTKEQQDAFVSSLGEEAGESVVSQDSSGTDRSGGITSTTETAHEKSNENGSRSTQQQHRPFLTALNSWKGSLRLREMFVPRSDDSANEDDDSMKDDDTPCTAAKVSLREMFVPLEHELRPQKAVTPAALTTRRCSSQVHESDVDDDGFLHWNDTQRLRK